jgi:pimeloyl-ACP methyl ester carboxylesterase
MMQAPHPHLLTRKGDGPLLVILHGLGGAASREYGPVIDDPALAGRAVLRLDLPGFGLAPRPVDFSYSIADQAQGVADLLRARQGAPVDLFGHSMGGTIAIMVAGLCPGRIRKLVLADPNLHGGGGLLSRSIAAASVASYMASGHAEVADRMRAYGQQALAALWQMADPYATHLAASALVAGAAPSWRDRLARLAMPRHLILSRGNDAPEDRPLLAAVGVQIHDLPESGHFMSLDAPQALSRWIAQATA